MKRTQLLAIGLAALLLVAASAVGAAQTAAADDDTEQLSIDASYENGTVTATITENDSALAGANVSVNGEQVGTTDENGTIAFDVPASVIDDESVTVSITADGETTELTYAIEDGELVEVDDESDEGDDSDESDENETAEDNETASDRPDHAGPPTDMPEQVPDHVSQIHQLVNSFLDGDLDRLGPAVSDVASDSDDAADDDAAEDEEAEAEDEEDAEEDEEDAEEDEEDAEEEAEAEDEEDAEEDEEDDAEDEEDDEEDDDDESEDDDDEADDRSGNAPGNSNAGGR